MPASAVLTNPSVERVRAALERAGMPAETAVLVTSSGACRVEPVGQGVSRVFVEKALAAHGELWAAAGHPHTVFRLSYPQLLGITGGREAELAA